MSVLSISLGSSLATVGISVANPGQLTAIRDTISGSQGNAGATDASAKSGTAKDDSTKASRTTEPELSPTDLRRIAELERIDAEVRSHEQAHISVGRGLVTSGPNYDYVYGPNGKQYAVAGEVGIDTSAEREAQANIDKGQRIQDTALAPIDPSPQDYRVAATGKQLEEQGRSDLREAQGNEAEQQRDARMQAYEKPSDQPPSVDVYV